MFMPVVSPEAQGITFDVLNTLDALKGMASAFRKADMLNQLNPDSPPLFPKGSQAIRPASVSLPVEASTSSLTPKEPKLSSLVSFPPNLMMFPYGQSKAAIADVIDVSYDEASATVTMQLDVVHDPVVFSQFLEHTPCSADTTEAHYHFATSPGMDVDAPALLQALKESSYHVEGLHMFMKSEPMQTADCLELSFAPSSARLPVGNTLNVTIVGINSCIPPSLASGTLQLTITGPGTIISSSQSNNGGRHSTGNKRRQLVFAYLVEGQGWFVVQADGVGEIEVASETFTKTLVNQASINITAFSPVLHVAKLLLSPTKAYRRCGDPVTLTALALDANHAPVPGVNINFAVYGDCAPEYSRPELTGVSGKTTVTLASREPGAVAVVAATQGPGGTVFSHPSHVIFFEEHGYVDRREHEYYRGRHDQYYARHGEPWGDEDDVDMRHGPRDGPDDRDAWHYGREAAKLAAERALGAPVASNI